MSIRDINKPKDILLLLIEYKARCKDLYAERGLELSCENCPLRTGNWFGHDSCTAQTRPERYKKALELYVNMFGKDPDLMELLI